jgi:hypothetical protein
MKTCEYKKNLIQAQMTRKSNQNIPVGKKKRNKTTILKGRYSYITVINKCEDGRLMASAFPQDL